MQSIGYFHLHGSYNGILKIFLELDHFGARCLRKHWSEADIKALLHWCCSPLNLFFKLDSEIVENWLIIPYPIDITFFKTRQTVFQPRSGLNVYWVRCHELSDKAGLIKWDCAHLVSCKCTISLDVITFC